MGEGLQPAMLTVICTLSFVALLLLLLHPLSPTTPWPGWLKFHD